MVSERAFRMLVIPSGESGIPPWRVNAIRPILGAW